MSESKPAPKFLLGTPENMPTIKMWEACGHQLEWIMTGFEHLPVWHTPEPKNWERINFTNRIAYRIKPND